MKHSVALEIAADRIRAVEVASGGGEGAFRAAFEAETPLGSVREGRVVEPRALGGALRDLWERAEFATRRCVVVLPSRLITQQMITVPPAPRAEQIAIVRGELERFVEIDDHSYFGWLPMTGGEGTAGNTLAFLVQDGALQDYEEALGHAGLQAEVYEPAALAALRVLIPEALARGPESQAPLDEAVVCRSPGGGATVTTRRLGYFRLGARADRREATASLPPGVEGPATALVYASGQCAELIFLEGARICYCRCLEADLEEAGDDVEGVPRAFVSEIERSLQYYRRAYRTAAQPRRLLLAGDHPALLPAMAWLTESQGIEVEQVRPAALQALGMSGSAGSYIAVVGGALRQVASEGLDLQIAREAPEETNAAAEFAARYGGGLLRASAVGLALVLLSTAFLEAHLRQAAAAHAAAAQAAQAAREGEAAYTLRDAAIRADLRRLRHQRMPVADLLRRLGRNVPPGVALTSLELQEDGALILRGQASSVATANRLVRRLTGDARFREPELETLDATPGRGETTFTVRTGLVGHGLRAARTP